MVLIDEKEFDTTFDTCRDHPHHDQASTPMTTNVGRRYTPDGYYHTEIVHGDFDDMERHSSRREPIRTISYNPEYEIEEKGRAYSERPAER